jgi:HTH-type transcriptional regulator / antitoxin MqsA
MKQALCPMCDFPNAEERTYNQTVEHDDKQIVVEGLRRFVCPKCDAVFMNDEQSRHNLAITERAIGQDPRYLTPSQIRDWREGVGITQRQAAQLFGGGLNAFSKYENGTITQTEAMDNLLWVTMRYPGLVLDLSTRRHVALPEKIINACGYVLQFSNTWLNATHLTLAGSQTGFPLDSNVIFHTNYLLGSQHFSFTLPAANNDQYQAAA